MDFATLITIYFVAVTLLPMLQRWRLNAARLAQIRTLEKRNGSRVITLIHRQEAMSFLGIPISRYIDIDDSEEILRAIKLTPPNLPIDIVIHTPGGLVLAAEPMSGGTLLAMAADEIVMDENAVLGPVDPQIGEYPAASVVKVVETKPLAEIDDRTLILADVSRKALRQVHATVVRILKANGMDGDKALGIADKLSTGVWTHDYPIQFEEAVEIGLPVKGGLPTDVDALMALYPQATNRRPSVQYIPMPYSNDPPPGKAGTAR
ncbi:MAG: hypothetical protein NTZ05_06685 [Chloroflexi bacterium]|nr:hypothetical protein [Chloroflexota bacterium]